MRFSELQRSACRCLLFRASPTTQAPACQFPCPPTSQAYAGLFQTLKSLTIALKNSFPRPRGIRFFALLLTRCSRWPPSLAGWPYLDWVFPVAVWACLRHVQPGETGKTIFHLANSYSIIFYSHNHQKKHVRCHKMSSFWVASRCSLDLFRRTLPQVPRFMDKRHKL